MWLIVNHHYLTLVYKVNVSAAFSCGNAKKGYNFVCTLQVIYQKCICQNSILTQNWVQPPHKPVSYCLTIGGYFFISGTALTATPYHHTRKLQRYGSPLSFYPLHLWHSAIAFCQYVRVDSCGILLSIG